MSKAKTDVPVTPICGVLYCDHAIYLRAQDELVNLLGPITKESEAWPFTWTSYYDEELGAGIQRRFLVFEKSHDAGELADWKNATIAMERGFGVTGTDSELHRSINLDPGYIRENSLVLASTKRNVQRVYLRDGIFGEATLYYRNGRWNAFETTFPDFRSGVYDTFLNQAREYHLSLSS